MRGSRRLPLGRLHRWTSKGSRTKIKAHAGHMGESVHKLTNRAIAETKGRPGMIPRAPALSKRAAIRGFIGLSAKGGAPSIVDEAPLFHANPLADRRGRVAVRTASIAEIERKFQRFRRAAAHPGSGTAARGMIHVVRSIEVDVDHGALRRGILRPRRRRRPGISRAAAKAVRTWIQPKAERQRIGQANRTVWKYDWPGVA